MLRRHDKLDPAKIAARDPSIAWCFPTMSVVQVSYIGHTRCDLESLSCHATSKTPRSLNTRGGTLALPLHVHPSISCRLHLLCRTIHEVMLCLITQHMPFPGFEDSRRMVEKREDATAEVVHKRRQEGSGGPSSY